MEVGLQESDPLWPVIPRLTSAIEKAFGPKDKVSRVHVAFTSGSEQYDNYDGGRSKIDEDKTLSEGCERASIQAVDDSDDD